MQEKLLKTLMSSMEMRKAGNSTLSTLMMEQASVEAARDINVISHHVVILQHQLLLEH